MFQGTGSGVGKSLVVAALCRLLHREGFKVAPFKSQNMALNSFVTLDGREMGRAQVYQAEACGLLPDVRMNPILLKPSADSRSQVILNGLPCGDLSARHYYRRSKTHWDVVKKAYDSLSEEFDFIVIEGAGSPAEINLQKTDIVNMRVADYADAPVIIVGDIDRGGVFAWLKGTYDLVRPEYRHRIAGFLINKFRGDVSLLEPGLVQMNDIVPVPFVGVLPWMNDLMVDQEDGVFIKELESNRPSDIVVKIVKLGRISNFTDFLALSFEPDVALQFVSDPDELSDADLIILPGTKATVTDCKWLCDRGWRSALRHLVENGRVLFGICGGYQILGSSIKDPSGSECGINYVSGLDMLPIETVMQEHKTLRLKTASIDMSGLAALFGVDSDMSGFLTVQGYEIHMGETRACSDVAPLFRDDGVELGAASPDLPVIGTYMHGIFDNDIFRRNFLDLLRLRKGLAPLRQVISYQSLRQEQFERLADWFKDHTDIHNILRLLDIAGD